MGRPSKSHLTLISENVSHRTKAELELRKQAEKSLLTGVKMKLKPWIKELPAAAKEYRRLEKLLSAIDKNDAIYENVINRYCEILYECMEYSAERDRFHRTLIEIDEEKESMVISEYIKLKVVVQNQLIALDKQLITKRKMLLDIEKESVMTINSSLRAIPKTPIDDSEDDPMTALLGRNGGG